MYVLDEIQHELFEVKAIQDLDILFQRDRVPNKPETAYLTPIPQIPTVDDIFVDVGETFP